MVAASDELSIIEQITIEVHWILHISIFIFQVTVQLM